MEWKLFFQILALIFFTTVMVVAVISANKGGKQ